TRWDESVNLRRVRLGGQTTRYRNDDEPDSAQSFDRLSGAKEPDHDVKSERRSRSIAWAVTILVVAGLAMLVVFAPLIAAVVFIVCVAIVAVLTARKRGFWSGVRVFIKEILFGW